MTYAMGQLCRRLNLPFRCGGQLTASKVADGQAMQEASDSMLVGLQAGANYVIHAAGWLEGGLTMGYEKFIMDLDHCGMMHHFLSGMDFDDNQLGTEAFREAGPGENFFGVEHTMRNFETANYMSDLADTRSFEQWSEDGSTTMEQRAHGCWKEMLASYEAPEIDPAMNEALLAFISKRKASMDDLWY